MNGPEISDIGQDSSLSISSESNLPDFEHWMSKTGIRIPESNEYVLEDPDEKDCLPKWVIEAPTKKERSLNFLGFQFVLILKNDPADPKNHILNLITDKEKMARCDWPQLNTTIKGIIHCYEAQFRKYFDHGSAINKVQYAFFAAKL